MNKIMRNWRKTREYRVWRMSVLRRDKKCVVCSSMKRRHAHHMNSGHYFPDGRFDVDNGVTLCSKCHSQFHNNYKRSYRTKCTEYDFKNFMCLVEYFKELNPPQEAISLACENKILKQCLINLGLSLDDIPYVKMGNYNE